MLHCFYCLLALHPCSYGAWSHLAPMVLHPLQLLPVTFKFPNGAHVPMTLYPTHANLGTLSTSL